MEQFFIVLVVLAIWIFRGVAGAQRRMPPPGPGEDASRGAGGSFDIAATTRQRSLEAQQKAVEALQRWEAKQGLSARGQDDRAGDASTSPATWEVPATARTRAARPVDFSRRTTAERERREAYADIAAMLDPGSGSRREAPRRRHGFEVERPRSQVPESGPADEARSLEGTARPEDPAAQRASARPARRPKKRLESGAAAGRESGKRREGKGRGQEQRSRPARSAGSALARLERLPIGARAVVYSEILSRPRSLS